MKNIVKALLKPKNRADEQAVFRSPAPIFCFIIYGRPKSNKAIRKPPRREYMYSAISRFAC